MWRKRAFQHSVYPEKNPGLILTNLCMQAKAVTCFWLSPLRVAVLEEHTCHPPHFSSRWRGWGEVPYWEVGKKCALLSGLSPDTIMIPEGEQRSFYFVDVIEE